MKFCALIFILLYVNIVGADNGSASGLTRSFPRFGVKGVSPSRSAAGDPLHLSPYIKSGSVEKGRELSSVSTEHMIAGIPSHAGYITVQERHNSNLWFWYFPVKDAPVEEKPLLIWLQGGPGVSSLFGLFTELGPFNVDPKNSSRLIENPYSWHNNHSIIFIDNPVGTGFSYTESDDGFASNQTQIGEQLYIFMLQFLQLFPDLQEVPLYITGESYAGKHIPSLAYQIYKNNPSADLNINLQGLFIGNGFIDPATIMDYSSLVLQLGLVDDDYAMNIKQKEKLTEKAIAENKMLEALDLRENLVQDFLNVSGIANIYNYVYDHNPGMSFYESFIKKPEMMQDLHVGNTQFGSHNAEVNLKLRPDYMNSAKPWIEELLNNTSYKIMSYSGQMDIRVAYPLTVRAYRSMKWKGSQKYLEAERKPWYYGNALAGYVKTAGLFSEVLVRNAGHMVPTDQPARSLQLITAFTHNLPLPEEPSGSDN